MGAQSATLARETDAAASRLGAHIRRLRQTRRLTLVQLAEATDLSHPFLSQLEQGLAQPSLGSLRRIATALGTSPIELVAAGEEPDVESVEVEFRREGDGALSADFAVGTARLLASGSRPFHPMEYVSDNTDPGELYLHDEDEFAYVLSGSVRFELGGRHRVLDVGESAYYAGGVPHRWWSADGRPFRLLVVKQGPVLGRRS